MLHPGYVRKILWEGGGRGKREYWGLLGVVETIVRVGFYSLSFRSFVLSQLVTAPVRMIPTYPSPKSTLALTSHLGQIVRLGEG